MNGIKLQIEQLTEELMVLSGPTTDFPYETQLATFIKGLLSNFGFQTTQQLVMTEQINNTVYECFNILAEKGKGEKSLFMFAHMDVPSETAYWISKKVPYFKLDHCIYGPGMLRVKGGLIALLDAITEVEPVGFKLKVALLVDGEGKQSGAREVIKHDWLHDVVFAITPQPVSATKVTHRSNMIIAQTDNEFMKAKKRFILLLEDYLKDYFGVDMIGHYPGGGTPESRIFAQYAFEQMSPFQVVGLGPEGRSDDEEGEWVSTESIKDASNILKFILSDFGTWLAIED